MSSNYNKGVVNIIDADTIVYLLCYDLREEEDINVCIERTDDFVKNILNNTHSSFYLAFLGTGRTFRNEIYPDYKIKRPDAPDWYTKWKVQVKNRMIDHWKFIPVDNIEAEDAAIICANKFREQEYNVVLSHVDKDLNFWEGNHYNYQKHEFCYVNNIGQLELNKSKLKGTGLKWMYSQIICGDSTDNIKGLVGKGPAFAYKLLDDCETQYSLLRRTYCAYLTYCKEDNIKEYFILQVRLICMLESPEYGFEIPELIEYQPEENIEEQGEDLPFEL
jgi:5'-3' exonuclease